MEYNFNKNFKIKDVIVQENITIIIQEIFLIMKKSIYKIYSKIIIKKEFMKIRSHNGMLLFEKLIIFKN